MLIFIELSISKPNKIIWKTITRVVDVDIKSKYIFQMMFIWMRVHTYPYFNQEAVKKSHFMSLICPVIFFDLTGNTYSIIMEFIQKGKLKYINNWQQPCRVESGSSYQRFKLLWVRSVTGSVSLPIHLVTPNTAGMQLGLD